MREPAQLVGRDSELGELRSAFASAYSGTGQVVLIAGDPGIGKTALLEALAREVAVTGTQVVWGRCWEGGGTRPYWPWIQVLRSCVNDLDEVRLAELDGEATADVGRLAPEVASCVTGLRPSPSSESADARLRLFDSVLSVLAAIASDRGMVILLEDLHAADDASLELLAHARMSVATMRLLVVGTYRDKALAPASRLRRRLDLVAAAGTRILLTGLGEADVGELLERAGGPATAETARQAWKRTDGNPFFVQEIGRLMAAGRAVEELPAGEELYTLVHRRLDHLPQDTRRLLAIASLLGSDFDGVALQHLTGLGTAALLDALGEAEAAQAVHRAGLDRWSFTHRLIPEALMVELRAPTRRAIHVRAGEAIESLHAHDLEEHYSELSHHFWEGGNAAKASQFGELAGKQALTALAFEDAAFHFHRALHALAESASEEHRRYDLLMLLARAKFLSHEFDNARRAHLQAYKLARQLGEPELAANAAVGYFGYRKAGDEPRRLLEEALAALPHADSPTRASTLISVAAARANSDPGAPQRWQTLAAEGVEMARRSGDMAVLCRVLLFWHRLLLELDPVSLETRLAVAGEVAQLAAEIGDRETLFWARQWRMGDLMEAGSVGDLAGELEIASEEARRLRLPYLLWAVSYLQATLAMHEGRLDDAERLARRALAVGERTGSTDVEAVFAVQFLAILRQQGRLDEMTEWARASRRLGTTGGAHFWHAPEALALALLDRRDEATLALVGLARSTRPFAKAVGNVQLNLAADRAEICWALGDGEPAEGLYSALLPFAERHVVKDVAIRTLGSTSRHLGQLATLLNRMDEADSHFQTAHRHHRHLRTPLWLAHGQVDHARMLFRRGAVGDHERAVELARSARDGFRALNMAYYESRAARLVDQARVTPAVERGTLRVEGDHWLAMYSGRLVRLADSKGLQHLARLLALPGREFEAGDLVSDGTDASDPERARQSVSRAVRACLDRIADVHPELGDHLRNTVRLGARCSYLPDPRAPVVWDTWEPPIRTPPAEHTRR